MNILIIPEINNIDESIKLAKEWNLGFEYNDFFLPQILDDKDEIRRRVDIYRGLGRDMSNDTMHGAFLDITVHSEDKRIVKVSSDRIHSCMDIAQELGVKGVVFHTNIVPNFRTETYLDTWVKRNEEYWRKLLAEYPDQEIYIENMFDKGYDELKRLGEMLDDEERFGVCLDYAHAVVFGWESKEQWVKALAPYIKHMHINDNDMRSDLHLPVGSGDISWGDYNIFMRRNNIDCSVLIECSGHERQRESLEYLKSRHFFPFEMTKEDVDRMNDNAKEVFKNYNVQVVQISNVLYKVINPDNVVNIDNLKVDLRECALITSGVTYDEDDKCIGKIYYIFTSVLDDNAIKECRQKAEAEYGKALVFEHIERKYDPSSSIYML